MVVTGVSALLVGALSVGLATAAQATRAGAASPGRYAAKVTVLPGQSLWSLAEAYDPNADTRLVIQEMQQLNSLTGDQVQPGEVLWVPRG
jgi:LysM repeat protein